MSPLYNKCYISLFRLQYKILIKPLGVKQSQPLWAGFAAIFWYLLVQIISVSYLY